MAIRQVQKEPELPPAHLYLEDVEEIAAIMTAATKKERRSEDDVPVRFTIGDKECDSVDDLKKLGGRSHQFEISAGFNHFRVRWFDTYCPNRNVFDKALRIMTTREMKIKGLARRGLFPLWVFSCLWPVVGLPILWASGMHHVFVVFMGVTFSSWLLCAWAGFTHSVVEFRYSYEPSPKAKIAKEWATRAIWVVLGVFLAGLAQWIWHTIESRLRH